MKSGCCGNGIGTVTKLVIASADRGGTGCAFFQGLTHHIQIEISYDLINLVNLIL